MEAGERVQHTMGERRALFVAEVKTCNPFSDWRSERSQWELVEMATAYGDIVAIHTHPAWGGSYEDLKALTERVHRHDPKKKVLAKGAHMFGFEFQRCIDAGADYVLTLNREVANWAPWVSKAQEQMHPYAWYEGTHPCLTVDIPWVVNSRSLATGRYQGITGNCDTLGFFGENHYRVQASNIRKLDDVQDWAWAFMVGQHLPEICAEIEANGG